MKKIITRVTDDSIQYRLRCIDSTLTVILIFYIINTIHHW